MALPKKIVSEHRDDIYDPEMKRFKKKDMTCMFKLFLQGYYRQWNCWN